MPVSIPKGRTDRVVSLDGAGDGFAEVKGSKGCARIQCREPIGTCAHEDQLAQKIRKSCGNDPRTPVLFVARFCDQVKDLGGLKGNAWGVRCVPEASTNVFEVC